MLHYGYFLLGLCSGIILCNQLRKYQEVTEWRTIAKILHNPEK